MGEPSQPTENQWGELSDASDLCYYDTTAVVTNGSWTATFPQYVYSVSLIVLRP